MSQALSLSLFRLTLLRIMYLFIFLGLAITVWPEVIFVSGVMPNADTVISAILVSFSLMALIGVRYPIKLLPLLLIELLWKLIWVIAFAIPSWIQGNPSQYVIEVTFACLLGIVLTPLVIPWNYVYQQYVKGIFTKA